MPGTIHFEWPWAFLALLLLPLLYWRSRRAPLPAVPFNGAPLEVRSRRQCFLWLPSALRCLALVGLIACLARPQQGARFEREATRGIAIQLLIDRSGSMQHADMIYAGRRATRLFTVTALSRQFIFGGAYGLKGRPNDIIGLVQFAADPITLCPLTLEHGRLAGLIDLIQPAREDEDGTAIGDAVTLAAARFKESEAAAGGPFKSKVIVLLTDGENNMGARSPYEAAAIAKQWGVRIYAIGIRPYSSGSRYDQLMETTLESLAETTGGMARMVADGAALQDVYRQIDRLEPTQIRPPKLTGGHPAFEWLAAAALALLAAQVLLEQTWLRRTP